MPLTYDEQQAEYKRMQDQAPDEGEPDLAVVAPKEPEVDPAIYRDVETMIFTGFLTQMADINGAEFVFKSLNHHEHELIRLTGGYDEKGGYSPKFWSKFIAYSVLFLDGQNVIQDRTSGIPKIAKAFQETQPAVQTTIVRYLSELNRRARRAVTLTECYAMEKYSRFRWLQVEGVDMTSTTFTGITGTENLGLNWAQLTWIALNRIHDRSDALELQWDHAKFIGSCSAGKGIQKVYSRDAQRRKKEREETLARKDALLRHVLLGEPLRNVGVQKDGAVWVTAQTTEELAEQLKRDVTGEKDWHDVVVDNYENRMVQAEQAHEDRIRTMHASHDDQFEGKSLIGGTGKRAFTAAEVRDSMIRRQGLEGAVTKRAATSAPNTPIQEITTQVGTTDRDPSTARPLPVAQRPRGLPFNNRKKG